MIEDVYEPLGRYRDEFRGKFAQLVRKKFTELLNASGVDVAANRKTAKGVRKLENEASRAAGWKTFLGGVLTLAFLGALGTFIWLYNQPNRMAYPYAIGGIAGGILLGLILLPFYLAASSRATDCRARAEALKQKAWEQLEPLNRLYTWDLTVKLIEETVPRLAFDPYFTAQRLADLERLYDWDGTFNHEKSMLFAQSGVINGNPFVFGDFVEQYWTEETYEGSKRISWTEWETDAEGRQHPVTRSETLVATVTAPKPAYQTNKFLLYGNDAAPNLVFTRKPSELSDEGEGFFARRRLKRKIDRLEEFSRNLTDDSNYTIMTNREFEALFETMSRNDEVEYRLLFTPIAQQQLLSLIKDRTVGFGDDFTFAKEKKINFILAKHLSEMTLDTNPEHFYDWDVDHAREQFIAFNESYFKHVYFALAPLLAVPLYQQTRTHEDIWKGVIAPASRASFWEHEALANFHGEQHFQHPECVTHSILKTQVVSRAGGVSQVEVTAQGFRGVKQVAYKTVYGGDGRFHEVAVPWTDYQPVSRTRVLHVAEGEAAPGIPADPLATTLRRSIHSWFGNLEHPQTLQ